MGLLGGLGLGFLFWGLGFFWCVGFGFVGVWGFGASFWGIGFRVFAGGFGLRDLLVLGVKG